MKPPMRIALRSAIRQQIQCSHPNATATLPLRAVVTRQQRNIHSTTPAPATVSPIHGTGPPPEPPVPAADSATERLERRKRQAEILEQAQAIRQYKSSSSSSNKSATPGSKKEARDNALRKRFWKDVHVREVDGAWEVHLDTRPLRRPETKDVVRIPLSKPLLAGALAAEWDMLLSPQQATRSHFIPLTGLVCRALDIADDDAASCASAGGGGGSGSGSGSGKGINEQKLREGIVKVLLKYLDTDSLLCWAPPPRHEDGPGESLRDRQKKATEEVVGFLTSRVWPGVTIEPVLDGESIMPRSHPEITRQIIQGWIMGLSPWELAGLERGALAAKSLLGSVRLLVEWSEGFVGAGVGDGASAGEGKRFGVEEAARLASIEVDWQTGRWGEVEDTHDVEKEDLRRQLGSAVLLVSGTGAK
ncbi:ATP12-domain-containing protein [Annulohypoxylon truncatum]|uniref:ATP12-domain-containing protein n=1 Tax=Annulohypoxylon truncatum TaxID=327061 RepID=UPI00200857B4|nr:ATP12-domain-containing protein [Annulohypoxylon truncatum]KAI1211914.1 ATP12-domain-containing protein [Annulohypoxylon truncatum]